ncbi:hypothetical protein [Streptomyces sp. NPDC046727]|uniref:hypothetical protein n=1 Tax=Streptomyces sp. NPDC046727 TaxID=3155373 RepID=UPI0033D158BA
MNWTNALAVFGAVTGAAGFGWQIWSHRLTGGRVKVLSTRLKHNGRWWVRTDVSNVGRLDVTIVGPPQPARRRVTHQLGRGSNVLVTTTR